VRRPKGPDGSHHIDKRISIEDSLPPKPVSDKFKAMRSKHYNEMAAIKAFKQRKASESSSDSQRSDDDEQHELITTNTNTNINTSTTQAEVKKKRPKRTSATSQSDPDTGSDKDLGGGEREVAKVASPAPEGPEIRPVQGPAQRPSSGSHIEIKDDLRPKPSSDKFKAMRAQHYNEFAAIKALRQRKQADETSSESERSDDSEAGAGRPPQRAPPNSTTSAASSDKRMVGKATVVGGVKVQLDSQDFAPSPRTPTGGASAASPGHREAEGHGAGVVDKVAWTSKRNAHYSEMAAAMRNAPPPSDEEDDDDDDEQAEKDA